MPTESGGHDPEGAEGEVTCRAVVERYSDEPNQCTIFPVEAEEGLSTAWITAKAPGFVDLRTYR